MNMASISDNTRQLNRLNVDNWSKREQLCLASAVSRNSEHNWNLISCSLKDVCDVSNSNRPNDWFSQKNCALQYEQLLENVNNKSSSSSSNTLPAQVMISSLTEERIQELQAEIRKEQEEYAKLYSDIKSVQSNRLSNEQLLQMWLDIEKEQEMHRVEEMKLENRLREREQKKNEFKKAWHPTTIIINASTLSQLGSIKSISANNNAVTKINVENILCSKKTNTFNNNSNATSPLLSSLLKSSQQTGGNLNVTGPGNSSSVRTSAPTITTLLTGGSIANANQPAIIPSRGNVVQLLTRPISGPPLENVLSTQTLLSPSQSAPTLSMLLEKTKNIPNSEVGTIVKQNHPEPKTTTINITNNKTSLSDANNEPVPMDIEEDINPTEISERSSVLTTDSNSDNNCTDRNGNTNANTEDTDLNEEQQLLEVFNNIGNIEELDIADVAAVINEEVDFLKVVTNTDSANKDLVESKDPPIEVAVDNSVIKSTSDGEDPKKSNKEHVSTDSQHSKIIEIITKPMSDSQNDKTEIKENITIEKEIISKIEIISSDDSNDNLPLATVASIGLTKEQIPTTDNKLSTENHSILVKDDKTTNINNESHGNESRNDCIDTDAEVSRNSIDVEVVYEVSANVDDSNSSLKDETLETDKTDLPTIQKDNENMATTATTSPAAATTKIEETTTENSESKNNFNTITETEISNTEEKNETIIIPINHIKQENQMEFKIAKCEKSFSDNEKGNLEQHNTEEKLNVSANMVLKNENVVQEHANVVHDDVDIVQQDKNIVQQEGNVVQQDIATRAAETSVKLNMHAPISSTTVADTDEDSSTTDASITTRKDEKQSITIIKTKRKSPNDLKVVDNAPTPPASITTSTSTPVSAHVMPRSSTLRKLRERDRSESPMVDDDTNATNTSDQSTSQRLRRRYSTPNNDSIPHSPASSDRDERELRASKKSLLSIFNILNSNKYASMLQRLFNEASFASKLRQGCVNPMDLQAIKKKIESGQIRTTHELQRDIMLMCQNVQMLTKKNSTNYKIILAFQHKCQSIREFMRSNINSAIGEANRDKKESKINATSSPNVSNVGTSKNRSGSRKSLRIS